MSVRNRYNKGLDAEKRVIAVLKERGYKLEHCRYRHTVCEIDLIMKFSQSEVDYAESGTKISDHYLMVEVKKANHELEIQQVLKKKQLGRLIQAFCSLKEEYKNLYFVLAIVNMADEVLFVKDILNYEYT